MMPDGGCPLTSRMPRPEWTDDFALAVDVYRETISFSEYDQNGYPTLTMLDFVMSNIFKYHEVQSRKTFFDYINLLHYHTRMESKTQ